MSQEEVCQQASALQISQGQILNITLLASEWKSSAGGLSTLTRELAIHLSQIQNVRVSLLVPEGACNDEDKSEARSFGISVLDAKKCVGLDPLLWLSNPPQDHKIDVIVGHGVKLGCQVQLIKRHPNFENCKWVHVVHTASEDLSKYKGYGNPISKGEKKLWDEVDLCKCADLVVPVGPKLRKAYHGYLRECKKDEDFFEFIPGLFERGFGDLAAKQDPKDEKDDFIVLLCGRGDEEDFEVKGYNIAVEAFADQRLKGKHYSLLFVGSPEGKQDEVRERLLNNYCEIDRKQLTVREFVKSREKMKDLFCEVDMVIMPSKSEGFGLVALEALSAGLPILVGSNSGFARAIEDIPLGSYSIVGSEDPSNWAERVESVRDRVVLQENKMLKKRYRKEYCWKTQCEELVERLWKMVYGTSAAQAIVADDLVEPNVVPESVCQHDPTTMQQHIEKAAVTSGRGQEGTSRTSGTSGDELSMPELADRLIKLRIETTVDLNEQQKKHVYHILMLQASQFMESRNYSKVKVTGVRAFLEFLETAYNVSRVALNKGSLIISLNCKTLKGLDQLWNDYLSGHLNKVAERYLVTDEMKTKLNLRKINLKTTIEEENYLNCRKVLSESSGEADSTTLSSQQGALDQGTGMIGMATAVDDEELLVKLVDWWRRRKKIRVKQEDTDWMMRMKKARASRSALHKASVNGQYEEVKKRLSSGCAVDVKDQFLLTPLHLACWYGQESVVRLLLGHGADVNATDKFQFTPLHKAERRNYQSIVNLLLDHKARPTFQQAPSLRTLGRRAFTRTDEHTGFNLLQAAVLEGDDDTVVKASVHLESFVEEMNCRTTGEKASIFPGKSAADILSAVKGRKESHSLIAKIYKEFVETEKTLSKLHSCAKRSDVEMAIELVLNDGMNVNVAAKRDITPLVWASPAASSLSMKTLIDLGADVNAKTFRERPFGFRSGTALRSAIHGNNAAVVKVLLANKAEANIADLQGNTVLHLSTSNGFFNISQLLIDSGCKVNGRNDSCETSLHSAVRGNSVADVKLLLRNNADSNIQDDKGNTPLHLSTRNGFCDISQLLVDSGCKINMRNNFGETPLFSTVRGKNVADVKLLLKNNADANLPDISGNTPLHTSTREGLCEISQLLIASCCKINGKNNWGATPLHSSVGGKNVTDVELLLKNNADANLQDTSGNTPLHTTTREGLCNISQLLIDSGCKINGGNDRGETPLHSAVRGKNVADVELLLKNNADANIQDASGNAPLHISTREGLCNISQLLIDSGCKINGGNYRGTTPLHSAVLGKNIADVKLLLKNNAEVNVQDIIGDTPLHTSMRGGLCDILQLLIVSCCKVNERNNRGETSLHFAVRGKNVAGVELLLKNNADGNMQDRFGDTPLHMSTREGFANISQLLIDSGFKINERNNSGGTPLHSAVGGKNVADVELLLKDNADTNIQDRFGDTPLHISTRKGFCDMSQLLIDSGCKINERNNSGGTPLHSAVGGKNVADVELLLKNNADANIQDRFGGTPLHISTRNGFCDISQLLVGSGCKINVRDNFGVTPLDSAVRGKNVAGVELLLKNNADANLQDTSGNSPLHISSRHGFSNISQLLIDSGCNKNLENREDKTPLDLHPFLRFPPFPGDSEEDKGNEGYAYASQKGFQHKSFVESEDKGDPWMNQPTRSTLSSPIVGKLRSGLVLKNPPELLSAQGKRLMGYVSSPTLYGDLQEDKGNKGYASQKSFQHKIVFDSEDEDDALIDPETVSSPIIGKGKEQSST